MYYQIQLLMPILTWHRSGAYKTDVILWLMAEYKQAAYCKQAV